MKGLFLPPVIRLVIRLVLLLACLAGCDRAGVVFHESRNPGALSDWGLMQVRDGELRLNVEVTPYSLNSPLFSDYTHKLRTVWMPEGRTATANEAGAINFPPGTILSKTFFYPAHQGKLLKTADTDTWFRPAIGPGGGLDLSESQLLETRLLVKRANGWYALPYLWNESQTEAYLEVTGAILPVSLHDSLQAAPDTAGLSVNYIVPDQNQCAGCHVTDHAARAIKPIGPSIQNLDLEFHYHRASANQLEHWRESGLLTMTAQPAGSEAMIDWRDSRADIAQRARSYLHINCGHCHSKTGPADTSGLYLDLATENLTRLGRCKLPIAAGQGTGGHRYSIVPGQPDASILVYRMTSLDPGAMMPEFGRSTVHREGVTLVSNWIASLEGDCGEERL